VTGKKIKPLLWLTDPWASLDHSSDTTLRLIEECVKLGKACAWADVRSLRFENGRVLVNAKIVEGVYPGRKAEAFRFSEPEAYEPQSFLQIHYRVDPPTDLAYTQPLQILAAASGLPDVVNPIERLLGLNEKIEALSLGHHSPPSVVASDYDTLMKFLRAQKRAVLKPLHQAQSKGVELIDLSLSPDPRMALEAATDGFCRPVILQVFLEGIRDGETRLWFVDGTLLAQVRKKPAPGEFKIDMDRGGTVGRTELSSKDEKVVTAISKRLKATGVRLAAVDLIDSQVTDWNLTSPGLIVQMESLLGENLAEKIVSAL